jgi:hypothetical protein
LQQQFLPTNLSPAAAIDLGFLGLNGATLGKIALAVYGSVSVTRDVPA